MPLQKFPAGIWTGIWTVTISFEYPPPLSTVINGEMGLKLEPKVWLTTGADDILNWRVFVYEFAGTVNCKPFRGLFAWFTLIVAPLGLTDPVVAKVKVPSVSVPAGSLAVFLDFEHPLSARLKIRTTDKVI